MTVGIVEWARRARAACAWELAAADALGRHVVTTRELALRLELVGRARRHAWRAAQWEAVVPVLHDVVVDARADLDPTVGGALTALRDADDAGLALAADDALVRSAVTTWQRWSAGGGPVADAPYRRAAEVSIRDAGVQVA